MPSARRERHFRLALSDPQPLDDVGAAWAAAAPFALIGIFLLLAVAALYAGRGLLLPVVVAAVIGETLAPLVAAAARRGVPRLLAAALLICVGFALVGLAVTLLAAPASEWIARAPEIGASIKDKLYVFDRPLAAWRELKTALLPGAAASNVVQLDTGWTGLLTPLVGVLTPALGQIVLFVIVLLFWLAGERDLRNLMVTLMPGRDARLRCLRIANDVRRNLGGYLAVVTAINAGLGLIVTLGAWLLGFPNPYLFGMMAAVLNYIPYLGSAVTAAVLFAVGLVIFPTLGQALVAPAGYVALASVEAQLVTPTVLGRRLTLSPLAIVLALAFWTWMWGPLGAFIAVPLSIVGLVTVGHLFPGDGPRLPQ